MVVLCRLGPLAQSPRRCVGLAGLQFQIVDREAQRFKADVLHSYPPRVCRYETCCVAREGAGLIKGKTLVFINVWVDQLWPFKKVVICTGAQLPEVFPLICPGD